MSVLLATPMGSRGNRPQEIEDGEAGFALLFPKIDGVKIHTFHLFKDLKNKVFDESKFAEAGKSLFNFISAASCVIVSDLLVPEGCELLYL